MDHFIDKYNLETILLCLEIGEHFKLVLLPFLKWIASIWWK